MTRLIICLFALGLGCAAPLFAQDRMVVVELFTSQGCSSCPPADEILGKLADRPDVIALALHVDYWDYIGWADPFGDANHATRQRAYAAVAGRRSIYTPEMIINGQTDVVGAKPMEVMRAIEAHKKDAALVNLDLTREGGNLRIEAKPIGTGQGSYTVHMLRYTPDATTQIKRGENAGHTFNYRNIAQDWTVLGEWDPAAPLDKIVPLPGKLPAVVLVQHSGAGPIAAAARIE